MATEKTCEGAQGSSKVIKSKRRRFADDEEDNGELSLVDDNMKKILAKELADYLDRTIEEVEMCDKGDEKEKKKEGKEPVNDFQLFSRSHQKASDTFAEEKQNNHQEDRKTSSSSDDEDNEETAARLKEAAISVQDIFGLKY